MRIKTIEVTYTTSDSRTAAATGLSISPSSPFVNGRTGTFDLSGTFAPDKASNTITWASSDATVLSVNPSTGAFSALKAGTANITATVTPSDEVTYKPVTKKVEYTVNDVSASFDVATRTILAGDTYKNTLTLTNTSGAVTYSSSDRDVATVAADGTVTGVAVGTATITANVAAVAGVSAATSANYTVKVVVPTYYTKVTSNDGLEASKNYLLVYENGASSKALGAVTTDTKIGSPVSVSVATAVGENYILVTTQPVNVLTTSEKTTGKWVFATSLEEENLCWKSGNSLETTTYSTSEAQWKVSISSGAATIKNVDDETRVLRYYTGSPRFVCYSSSTGVLPTLYKEDTRTLPTLTKAGTWADAVTLMVGDTWNKNTVTDDSDATGAYASDDADEDYISVNASTGVVTAKDETASDVTVTYSVAGTATYRPDFVSYTVSVVKPEIATITSITPSDTSLDYGEDGTTTVVATIYNTLEDASDKYDCTFTSSNPAVVSVNASTGAYNAVAEGTATITVTYAPKSAYAARYKTVQMTSTTITVTDSRTVVATIGDMTPLSVALSETGSFSKPVTPATGLVEGTDYDVTYALTENDDAALTAVTTAGAYTASDLSVGTAKVTLTVTPKSGLLSTYKPVSREFTVTVTKRPCPLSIDVATTQDMQVEETLEVEATSSSLGTITWSTDDEDIATVEDGVITATGSGTTTIRVSQAESDIYVAGEIEITVNVTLPSYMHEGTILFGNASGSTQINDTSVEGDDSEGNTWSVTTETEDKSFSQNVSYSQVGSSSKPATSITFTTTLPDDQNIKKIVAKFGGFSNTAGTITLKVDDTEIGTGSLDGTSDVFVRSLQEYSGKTLTITVTAISKGVKCYYIRYLYDTRTPVTTLNSLSPLEIYRGEAGDFVLSKTDAGSNTIVYASDNAGVLSLGADGHYTANALGRVNVKVKVTPSDAVTYSPVTGTYSVKVIDRPQLHRYVKVDDTAELTAGDSYLIVYEGTGVGHTGAALFKGSLEDPTGTDNQSLVTIENDGVRDYILHTTSSNTANEAFVITRVGDEYTILGQTGNAYIGKEASGNGMDKSLTTPYKNTITVTGGTATITGAGGSHLQHYTSGGNLYFRYYTSTQQSVALYKREGYSCSLYGGDSTPDVQPANLTGATGMTANTIAVYDLPADLAADATMLASIAGTNVVINGVAQEIVLTDKEDFYAPASFTAERFTYGRTNTLGYNTVCMPIEIAAENKGDLFGDEAKVYTLEGQFVDGGRNRFRFVEAATNGSNSVPAGTPVLVYNETETSWDCVVEDVTVIGETSPLPVGYPRLHGVFRGEAVGTGHYKLNSAGNAFVRTTSSSTVKPFRFYMEIDPDAEAPAQMLFSLFDWDLTDGPRSLNPEDMVLDDGEDWFDMSGRRIASPKHSGIYIHAGHKVVLK